MCHYTQFLIKAYHTFTLYVYYVTHFFYQISDRVKLEQPQLVSVVDTCPPNGRSNGGISSRLAALSLFPRIPHRLPLLTRLASTSTGPHRWVPPRVARDSGEHIITPAPGAAACATWTSRCGAPRNLTVGPLARTAGVLLSSGAVSLSAWVSALPLLPLETPSNYEPLPLHYICV